MTSQSIPSRPVQHYDRAGPLYKQWAPGMPPGGSLSASPPDTQPSSPLDTPTHSGSAPIFPAPVYPNDADYPVATLRPDEMLNRISYTELQQCRESFDICYVGCGQIGFGTGIVETLSVLRMDPVMDIAKAASQMSCLQFNQIAPALIAFIGPLLDTIKGYASYELVNKYQTSRARFHNLKYAAFLGSKVKVGGKYGTPAYFTGVLVAQYCFMLQVEGHTRLQGLYVAAQELYNDSVSAVRTQNRLPMRKVPKV